MKKVILAYIPVLHQGYLKLFAKHPEAKTLYLIDESLTENFRQLVKDIRALPTDTMQKAITALGVFEEVRIINKKNIEELNEGRDHFIVPFEDEMRQIIFDYLPFADDDDRVKYDLVFLRWDKKRTESRTEVQPDVVISQDEFDTQVMSTLQENTQFSSDWWRQVTCALVKNKKVIWYGINKHMPHDMQAYSDGDPRANYQSGEMIELSTSIHAESYVIAEAAKAGVKTDGCNLYVSTFPCPVCAKLIAQAGIKKLYYLDGYSLLDGENVLKAKGVEIIKVEMKGQHGGDE